MNNRRDNSAKLLADTFHDEWTDGRPAQFARAAAAHARARRRLKRSLSVAAVALMALAAFAILDRRGVPATAPSALPVSPSLASSATNAALPTSHAAPAYEVISDDEFLAQVRDRAVVAVKHDDGRRDFVLLDSPAALPTATVFE